MIRLAIPMFFESISAAFFTTCDIYFVARLGAGSVAIVGIMDSLLAVLFTMGAGLSVATATLTAQLVGGRNPSGAADVVRHALVIALALGVSGAIVGTTFGPAVVASMTGVGTLSREARVYVIVSSVASVLPLLQFLLGAALRGSGNPTAALRMLVLSNIANLVLTPFLLFGLGPVPPLGLGGVSFAVTAARLTGVGFGLLACRYAGLLSYARAGDTGAAVRRLMALGLPAALQASITTLSWSAMTWIVATLGVAAVADYTVAMRVIFAALLPGWAFGGAGATLVGQHIGAAKFRRAMDAAWTAARYNAVLLGSISVLMIVSAPYLVHAIEPNGSYSLDAVKGVRILASGFVFYAYGIALLQAFTGAGDTRTPSLLTFIVLWLVELPLAHVLGTSAGLRLPGVFAAISIAFAILALSSVLSFRHLSRRLAPRQAT